jgi:hypothetical protein
MLFNVPSCKSQAPVAVAAVFAAISSLRFTSCLPALNPSAPPLPEEDQFAALLASDPSLPEPLRLVLATGDVHAALARQLFRWAETMPRGLPRLAPCPPPWSPPPPRVPPPLLSAVSLLQIHTEPPLALVHQVLSAMPNKGLRTHHLFDIVPLCLRRDGTPRRRA